MSQYLWLNFALLHLFAPCVRGNVILYFSMRCRWVPAEHQLAPVSYTRLSMTPSLLPPHLLQTRAPSLLLWPGRSVRWEQCDPPPRPGCFSKPSDASYLQQRARRDRNRAEIRTFLWNYKWIDFRRLRNSE